MVACNHVSLLSYPTTASSSALDTMLRTAHCGLNPPMFLSTQYSTTLLPSVSTITLRSQPADVPINTIQYHFTAKCQYNYTAVSTRRCPYQHNTVPLYCQVSVQLHCGLNPPMFLSTQYSTTLLPSVSTITLRSQPADVPINTIQNNSIAKCQYNCTKNVFGAKYCDHTFTPIIKHH